MIDHLPRNSALVEAQANDEDVAKLMLTAKPSTTATERLSEWSPERDALARIEEWLQAINRSVVASMGVPPAQFRPVARPTTALQRLRADERRKQHLSLVKRVTAQAR